MKKKALVIVSLALTLSIAGCGNKQGKTAEAGSVNNKDQQSNETVTPAEEIPTEEATPTEEVTPAETADEEQTKALTDILDEIKEHVQIGTAGSSLGQAKYAAKLLDWTMTTTLTEDEVKDTVAAYLSSIQGDSLTDFKEQVSALDGAFQELKKDNAQDLLSCAGCEDTSYPWNDTAKGMMDTIMTAVLGDARE